MRSATRISSKARTLGSQQSRRESAPQTTAKLATPKQSSGGPRKPSRHRGVLRYEALLEATEELLQERDPGEIGLYQIAEKAGVPPASVYHFFPTREAAYQALAERYLEALVQVHRQPIEARLLQTWQDLFAYDLRRGMDFYNAHVPMMKILFGGHGGVEARNIDIMVTRRIANSSYRRLNTVFHAHNLRDVERVSQIRLAILDSIWTLSVRQHGRITEEWSQEAFRACMAYVRIYLPETLEPRELLVRAQERGESLSLPFAEDDGGGEPEARSGAAAQVAGELPTRP